MSAAQREWAGWFRVGLAGAASVGISSCVSASVMGVDSIASFLGAPVVVARLLRLGLLAVGVISTGRLRAQVRAGAAGAWGAALGGAVYLAASVVLALAILSFEVGDLGKWISICLSFAMAVVSALVCAALLRWRWPSAGIVAVGVRYGPSMRAATGTLAAAVLSYVLLKAAGAESLVRVNVALALVATAAVLFVGVAVSRDSQPGLWTRRLAGLVGAALVLIAWRGGVKGARARIVFRLRRALRPMGNTGARSVAPHEVTAPCEMGRPAVRPARRPPAADPG